VVVTLSWRWVRWLAALSDESGGQAELHERRWLLHHPWEEDYLHWVGEGEQRRLHGTVPPPQDGRPHSTTRGGWCRGLATEELQARRDRSL
jgi:hypothetical protein